jgi:hypothetical protein
VASADWTQPTGTRLIWQLSGPVDFLEPVTTSSTSCKIYAMEPSGRGEASVQLRYELDLNGHTYSAPDTSDGAKSQLNPHALDVTYRQMSCHRPKELLDQVPANKVTVVQTYSPPNPPQFPLETYGFIDRYGLRLWSWIGDPYPEVWVQERFPSGVPTQWDDGHAFDPGTKFEWNGTSGGKWTTMIPPGIPGYTYSGNMHYDFIGFAPGKNGYTGGWHWGAKPLSGGVPVLSFVHDFYAATSSTVNGNPTGIFVGRYEAKCYTDGTTHIRQ